MFLQESERTPLYTRRTRSASEVTRGNSVTIDRTLINKRRQSYLALGPGLTTAGRHGGGLQEVPEGSP